MCHPPLFPFLSHTPFHLVQLYVLHFRTKRKRECDFCLAFAISVKVIDGVPIARLAGCCEQVGKARVNVMMIAKPKPKEMKQHRTRKNNLQLA